MSRVAVLAAALLVATAGGVRSADAADGAVVIQPSRHDISPPLRLLPAPAEAAQPYQKPELELPRGVNQLPVEWDGAVAPAHSPHMLQTEPGTRLPDPPLVNVEGLGNGFPGYPNSGPPPDTTGAIGRDHFVQWVNLSWAVFDKATGAVVEQTGNDWRPGNSIWSGFGGPCETTNNGDPVVLYDQLADRWVMSQLALTNFTVGPFYQCVAVSTTSDPFGPWNRAAYEWPDGKLNDYPKLAVWLGSYTITVNEFDDLVSQNFEGAGIAAFDREAFLAGGAPAMVYFDLGIAYGGLLPAELDGSTEPPADTPALFFGIHNGLGNDHLEIWKLAVDWSDPGAATLGGPGYAPDTTIPVESFGVFGTATQPSGASLDTLSDRLMFRAAYRNFGDHESVVLNHSVRASTRNAVRWYEVRDPAGTAVLWQQGTYAPDDDHRWMGSIAMDAAGNIALGYSVSSGTTSPAIRFTGRLAGDPLGEMTIAETSIQEGTGAQTLTGRWGDYSTMTVDPVDDCTFWYTHEYVSRTGVAAWASRIAAFRLPGCPPAEPIFADDFEAGDIAAWSSAAP